MIHHINNRKQSVIYRLCVSMILLSFVSSFIAWPTKALAQNTLPMPGTLIQPSASFFPAVIRGVKLDTENPFRFDFIIDTGDAQFDTDAMRQEAAKLVKYFLASLTVPESDLWVNLSPQEEDRIIPEGFDSTEMGRDLLAQDFLLKQLTASLMHPENEWGKKFWKRIFEKTGLLENDIHTNNRVWIVPEKAVIYADGQSAFVTEAHLKVMLEQDYLSQKHSLEREGFEPLNPTINDSQSTQILKEIIIPEIEKEINHGEHFAQLRQIYYSLILATWFKRVLKSSVLGQYYVNQGKVDGINTVNPSEKEDIYQQYLAAYKVGVYDYIKEDYDPASQEIIEHKYFSGGVDAKNTDSALLGRPLEKDALNRITDSFRAPPRVASVVLTNPNPDFSLIAKLYDNIQPDQILTNGLKTPVHVFNTPYAYAQRKAREMADVIIENNTADKDSVFIMATGSTQEPVYAALVKIIVDEDIDISRLITLNMDEYRAPANYQGNWAQNPDSYRAYMQQHLFGPLRELDKTPKKIIFFNGQAPDPQAEQRRVERAFEEALQTAGRTFGIGGVGRTGHFAFVEPKILIDWAFLDSLESPEIKAKILEHNEFIFAKDIPQEEYEETIYDILYAHGISRGEKDFNSFVGLIRERTGNTLGAEDLAKRLLNQTVTIYISGLTPTLEADLNNYLRRNGLNSAFEVEFKDADKIGQSKTSFVQLAFTTVFDNARFFDNLADVPVEAFTVDIGLFKQLNTIRISSSGSGKAVIQKRIVTEEPTHEMSQTLLQGHSDLIYFVDQEAAQELLEDGSMTSTKKPPIQIDPAKVVGRFYIGVNPESLDAQRAHFFANVKYFNEVVLTSPKLTADHLAEMYAWIRGDNPAEGYESQDPNYSQKQKKLRIKSIDGSATILDILNRANTRFDRPADTERIIAHAAKLYGDIIKGRIFENENGKSLEGFNSGIRFQNHVDDAGYHALARFVMNYFLIINGFAPFYITPTEYEQITLPGFLIESGSPQEKMTIFLKERFSLREEIITQLSEIIYGDLTAPRSLIPNASARGLDDIVTALRRNGLLEGESPEELRQSLNDARTYDLPDIWVRIFKPSDEVRQTIELTLQEIPDLTPLEIAQIRRQINQHPSLTFPIILDEKGEHTYEFSINPDTMLIKYFDRFPLNGISQETVTAMKTHLTEEQRTTAGLTLRGKPVHRKHANLYAQLIQSMSKRNTFDVRKLSRLRLFLYAMDPEGDKTISLEELKASLEERITHIHGEIGLIKGAEGADDFFQPERAPQRLLTNGKSAEDLQEEIFVLNSILEDFAITALARKNPGGIDFNPNTIDLDIKGSVGENNALFSNIENEKIRINGLYPIIINIRPLPNLPLYLGMTAIEKPKEVSRLN